VNKKWWGYKSSLSKREVGEVIRIEIRIVFKLAKMKSDTRGIHSDIEGL
jgi:hypothetical protein